MGNRLPQAPTVDGGRVFAAQDGHRPKGFGDGGDLFEEMIVQCFDVGPDARIDYSTAFR